MSERPSEVLRVLPALLAEAAASTTAPRSPSNLASKLGVVSVVVSEMVSNNDNNNRAAVVRSAVGSSAVPRSGVSPGVVSVRTTASL